MDTAKLRALKEINKMVTLPPARTSPQTEFMSFTKARALTRAQHFTSKVVFHAWKRPMGMPSAPNVMYVDSGWLGYGDFLGTGNSRKKEFMPFTKARTLAQAQHFTGQRTFSTWKKPVGMPSNPNKVYKNSGWLGFGDFLGTGNTSKHSEMPFIKARKIVRAQHFTGANGFRAWKKPEGMPSNPNKNYKNFGWISWGDFLGTKKRRTQ